MLQYEIFFKYSHIYMEKVLVCMKINTLHLHYEYSHRHQPLYFNQTMGKLSWRCFILFFFFSSRLLITLKFMIIYNYSKIRFHICIKCMIIESDKKIMEFFHKPHLYLDLWKYFILPVRLLITLESTTKWYYWYKNRSHFHQLHKYGVW